MKRGLKGEAWNRLLEGENEELDERRIERYSKSFGIYQNSERSSMKRGLKGKKLGVTLMEEEKNSMKRGLKA